jgi:hypothetical protein
MAPVLIKFSGASLHGELKKNQKIFPPKDQTPKKTRKPHKKKQGGRPANGERSLRLRISG